MGLNFELAPRISNDGPMVVSQFVASSSDPETLDGIAPPMDGSDPPAASSPFPSAAPAAGDDRPPAEPQPERCEALARAIAGVLGGALQEHEARAAATARSQDELAAAVDRLNGELDKLLESAPSPVIMQQAARISSIRKRVLALNMLLRSIQRRIDNIDRIVSTGVTSDNSSHVQLQNQS